VTPRYFTYRRQVPLGAGQRLAFAAGRGYYAAPMSAQEKASMPQPGRPAAQPPLFTPDLVGRPDPRHPMPPPPSIEQLRRALPRQVRLPRDARVMEMAAQLRRRVLLRPLSKGGPRRYY
jgi:hypothetical protein